MKKGWFWRAVSGRFFQQEVCTRSDLVWMKHNDLRQVKFQIVSISIRFYNLIHLFLNLYILFRFFFWWRHRISETFPKQGSFYHWCMLMLVVDTLISPDLCQTCCKKKGTNIFQGIYSIHIQQEIMHPHLVKNFQVKLMLIKMVWTGCPSRRCLWGGFRGVDVGPPGRIYTPLYLNVLGNDLSIISISYQFFQI